MNLSVFRTAHDSRRNALLSGELFAFESDFLTWKKNVSAQSCLSLCDPMDCSPRGSSVYWISQARILEWVAISYSRDSSGASD